MSVLHVNQIAGALHRVFDGLVDLSDANAPPQEVERLFLSRTLAAFALVQLANALPAEAAAAITDGQGDNGIDALHFDRASKTLFVVQSKWIAATCSSSQKGLTTSRTKTLNALMQRLPWYQFREADHKIEAQKIGSTANCRHKERPEKCMEKALYPTTRV